jgi:hypothetical protein
LFNVGLLLGRTNEKTHASKRVLKPQARTDKLVIEELGAELLIYDSANKRAHCLGSTAASVWRACDGEGDVATLSKTLNMSADDVSRTLDELEALELFEFTGLEVLQSASDEETGITRRQLTMRSVKAGAAAATLPLVYSINVSPALATLTPIPFQCEVYTVKSCGASTGCGSVAGCCCCCQGNGSCKTCGATAFCDQGTQPCAPLQGGDFGAKCSDKKGTFPADPQGCCGISGADSCGCGFGPQAGCCTPAGTTCVPGATNCFPCCNGTLLNSSNQLGCCKSSTVNCCTDSANPCCVKSGFDSHGNFVDCCTNPSGSCCAGGCAQHT